MIRMLRESLVHRWEYEGWALGSMAAPMREVLGSEREPRLLQWGGCQRRSVLPVLALESCQRHLRRSGSCCVSLEDRAMKGYVDSPRIRLGLLEPVSFSTKGGAPVLEVQLRQLALQVVPWGLTCH